MAEYQCSICRKHFPFEKIRYNEQQQIVCKACSGHKEEEDAKIDKAKAEELKIPFICSSCRFKFSLGIKQAKRCPYCGKGQLMEVKKYKDVNDLIDESADEKYSY